MNAVLELLNPDNTVTINRPLAHALGTNEAIIFSALLGKQAYYEQHKMLDEDGWFYSTISDLQESTGLTRYQQDSAIKNLTDANLIKCRRKGAPARRHFLVNTDKEIIAGLLKKGEEIMRSLNPTSQKISKQVCGKTTNLSAEKARSCLLKTDEHTYKTKDNKSKVINPNLSIKAAPNDRNDMIDKTAQPCSADERSEYLSVIRSNIEYDCFEDKKAVNELIDIMLDIICSNKPTIRVNGDDIPHEIVKSRFLKIDSAHVEYVLTALKKNTSDVRNIRAYLITALYNAPSTIDSYYTAWVNHDMRGET